MCQLFLEHTMTHLHMRARILFRDASTGGLMVLVCAAGVHQSAALQEEDETLGNGGDDSDQLEVNEKVSATPGEDEPAEEEEEQADQACPQSKSKAQLRASDRKTLSTSSKKKLP
jgi:hypothetical protein